MIKFYFILFIVVVNCLTLPQSSLAYPEADAFLGEKLFPAEAYHADRLQRTIVKSMLVEQPLRDAHPKAHGCVAARFTVRQDLAPSFQYGVFKPGASYKAWIRFSNGSPNVDQDDGRGDTRGMAIKLLGVPGEKLMPVRQEASSQDFVMINSPKFFINEPSDYETFFRLIDAPHWWQKLTIPFYLGWQGSVNAWQMLRAVISNPLHTRYWSTVAYQLGEGSVRQAVKFSARPCEKIPEQTSDNTRPDYLREAMRSSLANEGACMDFMIQKKAKNMFVEDHLNVWEEDIAPFEAVARITIAAQDFTTTERDDVCENLSFNPWHSLAAHKPLGAVSRVRLQVYKAISDRRLALRGAGRNVPEPPL